MKKWLLIWGCWVFVAFFFTSETVLRGLYGYAIDGWALLVRELINYQVWFALTPVVLWLSRRVPIENRSWTRGLAFQIFAAVIVSLLHVAVYVSILHVTDLAQQQQNTYFRKMQNQLMFRFHFNLVCYWAVFGISYAIDYYRKYRERDLLASQLETKLAQSQLQLLKTQLQPHFLFNTPR